MTSVGNMKPFRTTTYTSATVTDLYTNSSGSQYSLLKMLSAYNSEVSAIAVEIYLTNASNTIMETWFNSTIPAGTTITDDAFHQIDPGYKIRFKVTGSTGGVQIFGSAVEQLD